MWDKRNLTIVVFEKYFVFNVSVYPGVLTDILVASLCIFI